MADSTSVHIGENSPERIAYLLLQHVANCEKRHMNGGGSGEVTPADRTYLLDTYSECLQAVKGYRG